MAGDGAYPLRSSWLSRTPPGAAVLYEKINFGDTSADEKTLWDAWFFGSASGAPYTLAASTGTFTIAGVDAAIKAVRTISASSGSFAITGNSAALTWSGAPATVVGGRSGGFGRFGLGRLGATHSPFPSNATPPTSIVLTAFPVTGGASAGVQRDIGFTTGSPRFTGTYSGGTPTGFQGRIRKVSDNSVVADWTTLTSVTYGGGTFSGKMAGVPQGAGYYRDVRCLNATAVTATDATPFMIGIGIGLYGQSNMNSFITNSSSPPSAHADTAFFDGPGSDGGAATTGGGTNTWVAVPAGDGVRKLLNGIRTTTGVPCFAFNASRTGTGAAALAKPGAYYSAELAGLQAMQGFEFLCVRHGESAASGSGMQWPIFVRTWDQIHSDLCSDLGLSKSTSRMIVAGLARDTSGGYNSDMWDLVSRGNIELGNKTGVTFSHSCVDATLIDGIHENGTSEGKSGDRFARTITTLLGYTSGYPKPMISGGTVVDLTTTDVDIAHGFGTDFTPTSGITEFEVTGNGGVTAVSATGVRVNGSKIRLTHASMPDNSSNRMFRYLEGSNPDISGLVLDNSSLNAPLVPSAGWVSPTPLTVKPVPILRMSALASGATLAQTITDIPIGSGVNRMTIVGITADTNVVPTSVVVTPNVGTAITLVADVTTTTNFAGFYRGALGADADAATSCTLTINYASNPFSSPFCTLWTVDKTALSSQIPFSTVSARSASASLLSVNLSSPSGGFNLAVAFNGSISTTVHAITGTETYATGVFSNQTGGSARHIASWTSNVSAHTGDSAVTATYDQTDTMAIAAVSFG